VRIGGWSGGKPTDKSSGELADRRLRLRVDAVCHEALEGGACRVDHAESCVLSSGDACGGGGNPLQHCIERELGADRDAGLDKRAEAFGFFRRGHVANRLRRKAAP